MCVVSKVRRRSGVPSNAITERERERRRRESGILSLLFSFSFLLSVARARARPRRTRRGISRREDTFFRVSLSHLAARVHDYDAPVPLIIPREGAPWTRTRGRLARSTLLFSCADRTRRWARARARAAPRDHGRYAVDPRAAAAAAARNRVNASPVVLLVHLGRRPGRRETAGLSSSLVVDRFIHDSPRIRGRVSRALVTGERPTIARTRAPGAAARKQSLVT